MIILIHSSKTMHTVPGDSFQLPSFQTKAQSLVTYINQLTATQIQSIMKVSPKLAAQTQSLFASWGPDESQSVAIDSFAGDIYSGLQTHTWSVDDRIYANSTLRILSGLYGIIAPLDVIHPYRLEMGYRLPDEPYSNLYNFWSDSIAQTLLTERVIVNLAAVEYSKVITPFIASSVLYTPRFLTINPKSGEPIFVVVHAKIARGAYAHWLIKNRITDASKLSYFTELGYEYSPEASSEHEPVFICKKFDGLGLSVRLRQT